MAWHREGLVDVDPVTAATQDYREAEDVFESWRRECTVEVDRGVRTKVGELFESWRAWCDEAGERPGRKQDFTAALDDHGIVSEMYDGNRLTRGVALVTRSPEVSSRTSPISTSTGTLRGRPEETSAGLFRDEQS